MANEQPSWNPVRKGTIYCAPACGHRCTWTAHQEAQRCAAKLCSDLGAGWQPHVWENMGWHYGAKRGEMTVHVFFTAHPSSSRAYTASIDGEFWGRYCKNPRNAVRACRARVLAERNRLNRMLADSARAA